MQKITRDQLDEILHKHELWLYGKGLGSKADLSRKNLDGVDLNKANLDRADLEHASLIGAELNFASLVGTGFTGADLTSAELIGADIRHACFSHADLRDANFLSANLSEATFLSASLRGANLSEATLNKAVFNEADLRWATLIDANLTDTDLTWASLAGANFLGANLNGAFLRKTIMDPRITKTTRERALENNQRGIIAFRSKRSLFAGDTTYVPGKTYTAPVMSWCPNTECHPGLHAATAKEIMTFVKSTKDFVMVYVRAGEYIATDKGIRCARFRVLRDISAMELARLANDRVYKDIDLTKSKFFT